MKPYGLDASPAAVGRLAADMARAAMTPDTRVLALATLAPFWSGERDSARSAASYVDALGRFAASVHFVREPLAVGEVVQAPRHTARWKAGDCDDLACCVAAFAAVVGLPAVVAVMVRGQRAHAVAVVGDRWDGATARLTHVIDHDGAKPAPSDVLNTAFVFPVSAGA